MKKFFILFITMFTSISLAQNVVVITLDTTRKDSLSCYGQKGIRTENLDKFSEKSYIFLNAFSPVPQTLPAHSTIFTGLYPYDHKVRDNLINYLPEEALTLAEILKEKGYSTGAAVSSAVLNHRFGLKQGFDFYDDKVEKKSGEIKADETTKKGIEILKKLKEPYFLWVHYYDPHHPYEPPKDINAPSDYLGEVLYMDKNLKPLFDLLNFENTLILIASDHGESLGEHNEEEHGVLLYNPAIEIPLLLHLPGQRQKIEIMENVSLTSIFPTIIDFLKIELKEKPKSTSLLEVKETPIYLETYFPFFSFRWSPLRGIINGNYKLILSSIEEELYDIKKDNKEKNNIIKSKKSIAKKLKEEFFLLTPEKDFMPLQSKGHSLPDEIKKQLQSLGYIDGGFFDPNEAKEKLPNPRDMADMVGFLIHEGKKLLAKKDVETIIKKVKEILKRDPQNFQAMKLAGEAYWIKEDYNRAKEIFESALKITDKYYSLHGDLGYTFFKLKEYDKAKKHFEKALELNEYYAEGYIYYAEYYITLQDFKSVETLLESALKKELYHPRIFYNLGLAKLSKEDYNEGLKYFKKAYELDNTFKEAVGNLAFCYFKKGEKLKAYNFLQEGLKIDPNDFSMLKASITVSIELNKIKEAEELIKRLIELYPESPEAKSMKPFLQR